jgi:putative transposase
LSAWKSAVDEAHESGGEEQHSEKQQHVALQASGLNQVKVLHRSRLLSDNGPSYVSSELGDWLERHGISHIRGRPYHPMTQGKIERYHRSMKNRILLENYYLP